MWVQQYYRCTVPGMAEVRWRTTEEQPPAAVRITSPYELEARYCTKRDTQWVGYKLHLSETCEPEHPDLITQVHHDPATTPDCTMGPPIVQDLAARDLLPGTHLLDSGYVDADFLVTAQQHQIDVVGPPFGSYSWQHKIAHGYDLQAFVLDWDAHQAHCPQGHTSVKWTPGHDVSGDPVFRIRFDGPPVAPVPPVRCAPCRLEARAILSKRYVEIYAGDAGASPRALEAAAYAIPIFEAADDRAGLARAWRLRVVVHGTAGRYDEAAAAAERVVEYAVAAGDARMATRGAQIYASVALVGTLPASEVRERCERLRAQVAGDRKAEAVILAVLAQVYAMQGDFARAREESERQRQMLAELGPSINAISTSIERARVESLAGDLAAAERELRADDAALAEIDERYFRSTVVGMLAGVLVEVGRFEDAAAAVETARELADEDDALSQILWRTAHARLLAEADKPDEAVAQAESAVALATDGDDIDLLGDVKSALGEVLWRAGRRDMAEPPLREALALYERKEDVASASRVRLRLETLASGADPTAAG